MNISWVDGINRDWRRASVASTICVVAVAAWLLAIGPTHVVLAPWDTFINLDEAWRLYLGQVPSLDFHNPLGPLTFLSEAYGMHLVGPSLYAVAVGNVLFLCLISFLCSCIAYRRLPPVPALIFVVYIAFLVGATRQVGRGIHIPGYCELYNRYGWSLLCGIFLQFMLPGRAGQPDRPVLEGMIAGIIFAILFYTKITFCAVAILPLAFAWIVRPEWRQWPRLMGIAAGVLAMALLVWLATDINIVGYLRDFLESGEAQTIARRWGAVHAAVYGSIKYILWTGIVWLLLVAWPTVRGFKTWRVAIRTTVLAAFAGACAILVACGNTGEKGEIPLMVLPGIIILCETRWRKERMPSSTKVGRDWKYALSAAIVALAVAGPTLAQDVASIVVSTAWRDYRMHTAPASQRFDAKPLSDFVIPRDIYWVTDIWTSAQVPVRLNDGFSLLRRYASPQQSVLSLYFSNPFPFALGMRPPRGTPIWFDHEQNITPKVYPAPAMVFADADFVIRPILRATDVDGGGRETLSLLDAIYGPYLAQHYVEVGRSMYWTLLSRRSPTSSQSPQASLHDE